MEQRHEASLPQIFPVQVLREHVTQLEAAMAVALDRPKKDPVHRLRTCTRRIEAQMALLELLPDLSEHTREADKARFALRKLRRAAGEVRDLDVQRKLLKEAPGEVGGEVAKQQAPAPKKLAQPAKRLRKTLKRRRDLAAADLTAMLRRQAPRASVKLEKLLTALESAEKKGLSPAELMRLTREWFQNNLPGIRDDGDPDNLHSIRKSAKLARYIAESAVAPGSMGGRGAKPGRAESEGGASGLAQQFERLQQAGGDWHDLLTLSAIARRELGKKDPLTETLHQRCGAALEAYLRQLEHKPA